MDAIEQYATTHSYSSKEEEEEEEKKRKSD